MVAVKGYTLPPPVKEARIRAVSKRALDHLRADPAMAGLIDRIGPPKLRPRRLTPFQSLVHAIIHQQLSGQPQMQGRAHETTDIQEAAG